MLDDTSHELNKNYLLQYLLGNPDFEMNDGIMTPERVMEMNEEEDYNRFANNKSQDLLLDMLYNQYLNQNTSVDRNQFLQDYKNRYNENFLDYLRKNKRDIKSLDDIEIYEDSAMDDLLDEQYYDDGTEWWR